MIDYNKKYCVYVSTHATGPFYAGKGQTKNILNGEYVGSGVKFKAGFSHEGYERDKWRVDIYKTFDDENDAYACEANVVDINFISHPMCQNLITGGKNGVSISQWQKQHGVILQESETEILNSQIDVRNVILRQDPHGRYSLNDLHVAFGKPSTKTPSHFKETKPYREILNELINEHTGAENPGRSEALSSSKFIWSKINGANPGTYACKELVYAYAFYLSPAFQIEVIRKYDAIITKEYNQSQQHISQLNDQLLQIEQAKNTEPTLKDKLEVKMMVAELFNIDNSKLAKDCARTVKRETGVNVDWLLRQI